MTGALAFDATAAEVQAALEALPALTGLVTVAAATAGTFPLNGGGYTVTFDRSLGNVTAFTATSYLQGGADVVLEVQAMANESPTLTIDIEGVPADTLYAGVWFNYQAWAFVSYDDTNESLEELLEELYSIISPQYVAFAVDVSGGPLNTAPVVATLTGAEASGADIWHLDDATITDETVTTNGGTYSVTYTAPRKRFSVLLTYVLEQESSHSSSSSTSTTSQTSISTTSSSSYSSLGTSSLSESTTSPTSTTVSSTSTSSANSTTSVSSMSPSSTSSFPSDLSSESSSLGLTSVSSRGLTSESTVSSFGLTSTTESTTSVSTVSSTSSSTVTQL